MRDVTERQQVQEKLSRSHDQLRQLSAALQTIREEERTHIARELHDDLGQMLASLRMDLTLLQHDQSQGTAAQRQPAPDRRHGAEPADGHHLAAPHRHQSASARARRRRPVSSPCRACATISSSATAFPARCRRRSGTAPGRRGQHGHLPHRAGSADQYRPPRRGQQRHHEPVPARTANCCSRSATTAAASGPATWKRPQSLGLIGMRERVLGHERRHHHQRRRAARHPHRHRAAPAGAHRLNGNIQSALVEDACCHQDDILNNYDLRRLRVFMVNHPHPNGELHASQTPGIAVIAAAPLCASAQTNVTMYGVVDAAPVQGRYRRAEWQADPAAELGQPVEQPLRLPRQ